MKILMLAWRDIKHPEGGGAEIVTDVYLKGLAKKGHEVTLFTAKYSGEETEQYNGYTIIRRGKKLLAHYHGLRYAKNNQDNFDIIIDQINTIPFFTPLFVKKEKRVVFFHQLCRNIWFYEKPFPISIIGYIAESLYLKLYRNTKAFTVSESSKQDLIKHAWMKQENILVLENQIDFQPIKNAANKENYFVFVGRLTKSKRVHHVIKALYLLSKINNSNDYNNNNKLINNKLIKQEQASSNQQLSPKQNSLFNQDIQNINKSKKFGLSEGSQIFNNRETKLYIIGDGKEKYKNYLKKLAIKLNLEEQVIFTGKIPNAKRNEIMQKSIAIIVTSVKEGWGLIVTEANANGTIAITYNTDGLRDANSNKTGFITESNTPEELAKLMNEAIESKDNSIMKEKSEAALEFAREHANWEKNIEGVERWIKG